MEPTEKTCSQNPVNAETLFLTDNHLVLTNLSLPAEQTSACTYPFHQQQMMMSLILHSCSVFFQFLLHFELWQVFPIQNSHLHPCQLDVLTMEVWQRVGRVWRCLFGIYSRFPCPDDFVHSVGHLTPPE